MATIDIHVATFQFYSTTFLIYVVSFDIHVSFLCIHLSVYDIQTPKNKKAVEVTNRDSFSDIMY